MGGKAVLQLSFYLFVVILFVKPLGAYMARVYQGKKTFLDFVIKPIERITYHLCGIDTQQEMNWKSYLLAMLVFNMLGVLLLYALQRLQAFLPLNPQAIPAVTSDLSFNVASGFVTNSDWQSYSGETTLSYLTQMLGLTVQNFLSAATGMALLIAFIRGLANYEEKNLGNFWVDTVRGTLYILLPLSIMLSIFLVSQGVIQNFKPNQSVHLIQPISYQQTNANKKMVPHLVTEQAIPMGPVASQEAIKLLGTNGDGFFNVSSAHPYENPSPLSNFFEMLAIIMIPAALCFTFGEMVKDKRQGWAIFIAMFILFLPFAIIAIHAEQSGNPALYQLGVDSNFKNGIYTAGNMEGKETRFGIVNSALFATVATATSNGTMNAMLDSFTPLGGMMPLWLMHLGEVVFGGVGTGLYSMLILVFITVFVSGLMVGRTPEYLGKKIEPFEMKMSAFAVLLMPIIVLFLTAVSSVINAGVSAIGNPGAHGFTEILYAFTSMGNNNGSAFAGLNANTPYYNVIGGLEMLALRFWFAIPTLAIAGSLAQKKIIPTSMGTLPTHTPLFVILLIVVTIVLGALTFLPALALGPIVEHLMLWR